MIESPKSLTAVIHVSFNYGEAEIKTVEHGVETLSRLFEGASRLAPEYQELLIKFANCLKETRRPPT